MTEALDEAIGVPPQRVPKTVRRAVFGGAIGTFVEFYDYAVYGYFAGTVAGLFFPTENRTTSLLLTYAAFAITFFFRPFGGIVSGYLGDKIGRRRMLAAVIVLVSGSTTAIGLLGTYAAIGIAAPILLVLLRLLQGFSVGGEDSGANCFVAEHSPNSRRAFNMSWVGVAGSAALLTGTFLALGFEHSLGSDAMAQWAWRVPFLIAAPLGIVGWYIRHSLDETPAFERADRENVLVENPLREMFTSKVHRKSLWLAFVLPLLNSAGYYVVFVYLPSYLTNALNYPEGTALTLTAIVLAVSIVAIPVMAALSDQLGRKTLIIGSAVAICVVSWPCFYVMSLGSLTVAILGGVILAIVFSGHQGVIHAVLVELFPTRLRYSGHGIAYNLSTAVFGGTAPLLMTYLISVTGNTRMPAYYVIAAALCTLAAAVTIPETARTVLREE